VRPTWEYEVSEERLSNGQINRHFIDRQAAYQFLIEIQNNKLHPFLAAMSMFDHFYINDGEWSIDADGYAPGYGEALTGAGGVALSVRKVKELARKVLCVDAGEGCAPVNDPICNTADVTINTVFVEGELFVRVDVLSSFGFEVLRIDWSKDNVAQTPVGVGGVPGPYALGPVEVGDSVQITFVNAQDPLCNDVRAAFVVEPDECEACLAISPEAMCIEIGDSEETPQSIETTSGYFTAIGPDNVLTVHENQFSTPNPGTYCVYPSTDDGTPSGEYFGGTVYFFGLKDIRGGTFANSGDPGQFGFSFDNAGAVVLPAIGPLEYSILISGSVQLVDMSELDLSLLVDFQISGGVESLTILGQFAYDGLTIQISQAPSLFASSVDTIANACNPALTGEVISDGDEPNPTAASQVNRQALYDSGGWTLPASWTADLTP